MEHSRIWVKLDVNWAADLGADAVSLHCAGVSPKSCINACARSDEARPSLAESLWFAGSPTPLHEFLRDMGPGAWLEQDTDGAYEASSC